MALLDDVKSELAAIDNELPIAKKAQATAMIRFGNGLHSVDHHILVQVQLDSKMRLLGCRTPSRTCMVMKPRLLLSLGRRQPAPCSVM